MTRLAVIGLWHRGAAMIDSVQELDSGLSVRVGDDPDVQSVRRWLALIGPNHDDARMYPSAAAMLGDSSDYGGVAIGTRCHLHTRMALKAAPAGLPLFLNKPVAISVEEVEALQGTFRGREDKVVVSFLLRYKPLFSKALEVVRSGTLGTINQLQAVNNVPYGGVYFGQWYRTYDQTGGLWLQKATHDFTALTCSREAAPSASPRWSRAGSTVGRSPTTPGATPATRPRRAPRAP